MRVLRATFLDAIRLNYRLLCCGRIGRPRRDNERNRSADIGDSRV